MGADKVEAKIVKEADMLVEVISWGGGRVCGGGRHGPSGCVFDKWCILVPQGPYNLLLYLQLLVQNHPSRQV